jgi:hypothetical protein
LTFGCCSAYSHIRLLSASVNVFRGVGVGLVVAAVGADIGVGIGPIGTGACGYIEAMYED